MLISEETLMEHFGYCRHADLRKFLDRERIPYMIGKGGKVVTTLEAINYRLIGGKEPGQPVTFL